MHSMPRLKLVIVLYIVDSPSYIRQGQHILELLLRAMIGDDIGTFEEAVDTGGIEDTLL